MINRSPLHLAIEKENPKIIELLLQREDIDFNNRYIISS